MNSLRNKLDLLSVEAINHDILTLSETWLNETITNEHLKLPGFNPPARRDREDGWGGVAIYVRDTIFYKERPDLSVPGLEAVWIEAKIEQETILVGSFYRPPDSRVYYWQLIDESVKLAMSTPHKVFILGDFNSDYLNKRSHHLMNIIQLNNLTQLVNDYTRVTDETSTCIDLVMTTCENLVRDVNVLPDTFSDHKVICLKLKATSKRHSYFKRSIMVYSKLNKEKFLDDLKNANPLDIVNN